MNKKKNVQNAEVSSVINPRLSLQFLLRDEPLMFSVSDREEQEEERGSAGV